MITFYTPDYRPTWEICYVSPVTGDYAFFECIADCRTEAYQKFTQKYPQLVDRISSISEK